MSVPATRITQLLICAAELLGSETKLAKACGTTQQSMWRNRTAGICSAELAVALEHATKGAVTRQALRPDLFGDQRSSSPWGPSSTGAPAFSPAFDAFAGLPVAKFGDVAATLDAARDDLADAEVLLIALESLGAGASTAHGEAIASVARCALEKVKRAYRAVSDVWEQDAGTAVSPAPVGGTL